MLLGFSYQGCTSPWVDVVFIFNDQPLALIFTFLHSKQLLGSFPHFSCQE